MASGKTPERSSGSKGTKEKRISESRWKELYELAAKDLADQTENGAGTQTPPDTPQASESGEEEKTKHSSKKTKSKHENTTEEHTSHKKKKHKKDKHKKDDHK